MKIVCKCGKLHNAPEVDAYGVPWGYYRCGCGGSIDSPIEKLSIETWEIIYRTLVDKLESEEVKPTKEEITKFLLNECPLRLKKGIENTSEIAEGLLFPTSTEDDKNVATFESKLPWPENCWQEIKRCHSMLYEITKVYDEKPTLICSGFNGRSLDHFCEGADTYRSVLINNDICEIKDDSRLMEDEAYLVGEKGRIHITGIKLKHSNPCSFCGEEIKLGCHADRLRDGRLVCATCKTKLYDSVFTP